ncbi:MAG: hypothetical protein AAFO69_21150 [Bacteroidota bacterium]
MKADENSGNAVMASFMGDHQKSIEYASMNHSFGHGLNSQPDNDRLEKLFANFEPIDATKVIAEQSEKYHFTLINEAHYSSMNRAFTASLLQPLWDRGYRYLALEALGYNDPNLNDRTYPTYQSGYYIRESTFANLIRKALEIGYQLIPYETRVFDQGDTFRDYQQAKNIAEQTWQKDKAGKVLIHVGYSHLNEEGDDFYQPMGSQLRTLTEQDILTIDQQAMLPLISDDKMHSYYQYAVKNFELDKHTVFVNSGEEFLVDAINRGSVDIQVYHPKPIFTHSRPSWLITDGRQLIELPVEFKAYKDMLFQLLPLNEGESAVPSDQFILSENNYVIAENGFYRAKIVDCEGNLRAKYEMQID